MSEGLFWLICHMDSDAIDWSENWEIYHLFVRSDALSHKDAWLQFAQNADKRFRRVAYNHYPRGRVVVRNGTAILTKSKYLDKNIVAFSNHISS